MTHSVKRSRQVLGCAMALAAAAAAAADLVVNAANVRSFYRDFPRLTRQPHLVAPIFSTLCTAGHSQVAIDLKHDMEKQRSGPHHLARVHLYVNPLAMPAITRRKADFPVGSVIVKEKLGDDGQVTGVGGMIKRTVGYDPDNGDWEYFFSGEPGEYSSGRIVSCIECHRGAQGSDHVFSVWNLEDGSR